MRVVYLTSLLFINITLFAQSPFIEGRLLNEKGEPVAFATILLKGKGGGTIASEEGLFRLSNNTGEDTLYISALGYYPAEVIFHPDTIKTPVTITLKSKIYELREVEIKPLNPQQILRKAIDKLADHIPEQPYAYEAFYRQHHVENNQPARLIEAAVTVAHAGYEKTVASGLRELIRVDKLRRSDVNERNKDIHDNHLKDLLLANMARYPIGTVLNKKAISFYKLKAKYIPSQENTVAIHFIYHDNNHSKIETGRLLIDMTDYSILNIQCKTIPNAGYKNNSGALSTWVFLEGSLNISYKKTKGKMYLDSISFYYRHKIYNPVFKTYDYAVDEYFNLWTGDIIEAGKSNATSNNFKQTHDLYTKKYEYDKLFWQNFELLKRHPLSEELKNKFERKVPLEEQFENNAN